MNTNIPLSRVLAAVVPKPRTGDDPDPDCCARCFEEAARARDIADWRRLREGAR